MPTQRKVRAPRHWYAVLEGAAIIAEQHEQSVGPQTRRVEFTGSVAHHILDPTVHAVVHAASVCRGVVAASRVEVHELLRTLDGLVHIMKGEEHEEGLFWGCRGLPYDSSNFLRVQVGVGGGVAAVAGSVGAVQIDAAADGAHFAARRIVGRAVELFGRVVWRRNGVFAAMAL